MKRNMPRLKLPRRDPFRENAHGLDVDVASLIDRHIHNLDPELRALAHVAVIDALSKIAAKKARSAA